MAYTIIAEKLWIDAMGESPATVDIFTSGDIVLSSTTITNTYKNAIVTKTTTATDTYRLTLTYDPSDTRNTLESLEGYTWTYQINATIDGESATFNIKKRFGEGYVYCVSKTGCGNMILEIPRIGSPNLLDYSTIYTQWCNMNRNAYTPLPQVELIGVADGVNYSPLVSYSVGQWDYNGSSSSIGPYSYYWANTSSYWGNSITIGETSASTTIPYRDYYIVPGNYDYYDHTVIRKDDNAPCGNGIVRQYLYDPYVTVTPSYINVKYDVTSATFEFDYEDTLMDTDFNNWTVTGSNLQSYYLYTDNGHNYCNVTFTANSLDTDRISTFTITGPTIFRDILTTVSATFYVTQYGKPHLVVSPSSVSVPGIQQTEVWTVTAVNFDNPVFQTPTTTGAFSLSDASITYPAANIMSYSAVIPAWNASSGSRTCTLSFTCQENNYPTVSDTKTSVITQTAVVPSMSFASGTKNISADGAFTINFTGKYIGTGWNLTSSQFNVLSFNVIDTTPEASWSSAHTFVLSGNVDPNLTLSTKTGTFVLTCTSLNGITMSANTNVSQASGGARLTFTPDTNLISNNGGTIHSTITTNIPNPTITLSSSVSWMTISGTDIIVAADATLASNRSGVITCTVTGSGYTKSETATITQYPKTFTISPTSKTIAADITATTFSLVATAMSNLSCQISGITNATATLESVSADVYNVNISLPENTGMLSKTGTITVSGTNAGQTFTKNATLTQTGVAMTITPSTKVINSARATFTVLCASDYTPNSLISSGTAQVTNYSYTYVGTTSGVKEYLLTIDLVRNTGNTDLTLTVTPSDTIGGITSSNSAVLTQRPSSEPSIVINPESLTVLAASTAAAFIYSAVGVSNLSVTISGGGSATLDTVNHTINIIIPANTGDTAITRVVTVSGVDEDTHTVTGTATLIQSAVPPTASLVLSPSLVSYNGGTVNAVVATNITNNTRILSSSESWISINDLTLTVAPNQTGVDRTSTITVIVTSTDDPSVTATATAVLTQGQYGGVMTISPTTQIVDGIGARFNVYCIDCTPTGVTSNGDIDITGFTYTFVDVVDGKDHYTLDLVLSPNMTANTLVSTIVPSSADATGESATLSQRPFTGIDVTPSTHNFEATGGSYLFSVYTNDINLSTLTVTISDSDISSLTAAFNSAKTGLQVVCGASTNTSATSAVITVSGVTTGGLAVSKAITVTQDGATPYINISPKTQTVSSAAGRAYINVLSTFDVPSWSVSQDYTGTMVVSTVANDYDNSRVYVVYSANNTTNIKNLTLHIRGTSTSTGDTITATATIYQEAGLTAGITPVWKDVVYTDVTAGSFLEYHIDNDGETLYAGKIYKMPDESVIRYSVNDVVSNYLGNGITFSEGIEEIPNYSKEFSIITTGANHQLKVYNSWAYKETDYWLSDPIDYKVSCKQWLPVSFLSTNYGDVTINGVLYPVSAIDKGWTAKVDLSDGNYGNEITVTGANREVRKYKIADGDFVLYYANAYGGWDSLLCNGTSKKTDNIESLSYRKKSSSLSNFSKVDYQKVITHTWSLNTGIIWNGEKMYHLLESTMVYLHNLKTNEIIPVVITNSSCDYLNYTNNGKQPVRYNITVEESNTKIRK